MDGKWKSYSLISTIGIAIAVWFSVDGCTRARNSEKDFNTLMQIHFRDSSELVKKTNELGQITATAKAFELSQESLEKYVAENSSLKGKLSNSYSKIESLSETISNFHTDTIRIPVPSGDTIPCADIEKSYSVVHEFYSFDFKFKNRQGHDPEYLFLNFNIPDTMTEIIGVKKSGFLNLKRTLVSEQVHTNDFIKIKGVKTIVKSEAKPKILKRFLIGFGTGFIAAIFVNEKLKK